MSYRRSRPLGAIVEYPLGPITADIVNKQPPPPPPPPPKTRVQARASSRARTTRTLGSLGDDTLGAMTDQEWKTQMLAGQRELVASHKKWADGDRFQKWVGIAATLLIPVSAAIWRRFGVGRRRRP